MVDRSQPPRIVRGRRPVPYTVREIIEALDEPLLRRGFRREPTAIREATAGDWMAAGWDRQPPADQFFDALDRDGHPQEVGFADGVSVWTGGYVNVGPACNAMHVRLEWRRSPLDPDEFACVVTAVIDQWDRFAPNSGPPLRRDGWTRG